MSQDPYTGYSSQPPQGSYQYGTPQNPQEASHDPYTTPPPYGYGGQQQQQSYSYPPPQATPLPLEQAIQELPSQYIKVLTNPSADTFAQEAGKASWNIVWVQLIGYAIICAILSYITSLILPNPFSTIGTATPDPIIGLLIYWGLTLGLTPLIILSFFISTGIRYLIAKAFRGQGTFLTQGYVGLLFAVPLGILNILVSRVPVFGGLMVLGTSIYAIVLHIFSIMAVHRLSGGKATAVVLLPIVVGILLMVVLVAIIVAMIVAAGPPMP
jgi:Yip1 domain